MTRISSHVATAATRAQFVIYVNGTLDSGNVLPCCHCGLPCFDSEAWAVNLHLRCTPWNREEVKE